ncbi:hypothetical protein [Corynebacterium mastitidis]|uniref:hypothetical protein n=1 Tax=Corynebacterium mastitidis TaxID=161890 RepID=UPI0025509269|nr:hypothetical protein [Corynebacterium mastitidis]MDK8450274.1 hypothetical protein [Corynebacterium mastitidis]
MKIMLAEKSVEIVDRVEGMTDAEAARLVTEAEAGYPLESLAEGARGPAAALLDLPEDVRGEIIRVCLESGASPRHVIAQILADRSS